MLSDLIYQDREVSWPLLHVVAHEDSGVQEWLLSPVPAQEL